MNGNKIKRILRRFCPKEFLGVFPCDRLPNRLPMRRPLLLVCNTDPHNKPGQHWIAIYLDENNRGEYFDSLGLPPTIHFEIFLRKFCRYYIYNNVQIQNFISHYCGHYVILFGLLKCKMYYSLRKIVNSFTRDVFLNDVVTHNLFHMLIR